MARHSISAPRASFWKKYEEFLNDNNIPWIGPYNHYIKHPLGQISQSTAFLASAISTKKYITKGPGQEYRMELNLVGENTQKTFESLLSDRQKINQALECNIQWEPPTAEKNLGCIYSAKDFDVEDESEWENQRLWFKKYYEIYCDVFAKRM